MDILGRTFDFSLSIIDAYKFLKNKNEFVLSKQLLRAGTSIGANVEEAQAAQSKKDFTSKMAIASKESRETLYWLKLLNKANFLEDYTKKSSLLKESDELVRILNRIVKNAQ